ncbi:MAG: hypothetical protein J3Q66DRAFT_407999 [Benniella sp.]|nr:MAG: hypothetical protein J3Q66DRAFT_407999 [Benniella sp.]
MKLVLEEPAGDNMFEVQKITGHGEDPVAEYKDQMDNRLATELENRKAEIEAVAKAAKVQESILEKSTTDQYLRYQRYWTQKREDPEKGIFPLLVRKKSEPKNRDIYHGRSINAHESSQVNDSNSLEYVEKDDDDVPRRRHLILLAHLREVIMDLDDPTCNLSANAPAIHQSSRTSKYERQI